MKLAEYQLRLVFEKVPELKRMVDAAMPRGYEAYLIFKEKVGGGKRPVISFRSV